VALGTSLFGEHAGVVHDRKFQALLFANVLPPLGSGLVSPVLDSLIGPLGTSAARIGLMISVFTAPSIAIIPVAGLLADRLGRRPVLVGSLVLFGVAGPAVALTTEFRAVLALRLLQGVAFGGIMPIVTIGIGDLYAGGNETAAQGIRLAGSGFVSTLFPLLSGLLVVVAWQYPFALYAVALPIAVLVACWYDDPTTSTSSDGDGRTASATEGGTESDGPSRGRALLAVLRRRRVVALVIARGLPTVIWIGFLTYNSLVVVRLMNGAPAHAGFLVAAGSITFGAAASQAGRLADLFDSQFGPLLVANACLGGGFVGFLLAPTLPLTGLGVAVVGIGFGLTLALYRSAITGLVDDSLRGSLVSLAEAFGRTVATATPVAMGAAIAVLDPRIGLESAVRVVGLGVAVISSGGGVVCLVLAGSAVSSRPAS
jgi:MFS family permease